MTLQDLRNIAAVCVRCELHKNRVNPVFDKGDPDSRFMICGMVPAHEENKQGTPFVGRAGKLLDIICNETDTEDAYITNLVKCCLAPGISLKQDWVLPCLAYIVNQINIIFPHVIVTLGADATNGLLGLASNTPIGETRGRPHAWGEIIKIIPTYHPSFLLRRGGKNSPHFKKVRDDFMLAKNIHNARSNDFRFESDASAATYL